MKVLTLLLCLATLPLLAKDVEVTIRGSERLQFDVKVLEVAAGDTIHLTFANTGKLSKQVMGQNVVVLRPGTDVAAFANAAMKASATEFFPESKKDAVIAHTRLLGPGERDTITFTLTEPGAYPYISSFPGHHMLMKGMITVR